MWEELDRADATNLYTAACMPAVTAAVLRAADLSPAGAKQADAEAEKAMAWLKKAVAARYKDLTGIEKDHDRDALRERSSRVQEESFVSLGRLGDNVIRRARACACSTADGTSVLGGSSFFGFGSLGLLTRIARRFQCLVRPLRAGNPVEQRRNRLCTLVRRQHAEAHAPAGSGRRSALKEENIGNVLQPPDSRLSMRHGCAVRVSETGTRPSTPLSGGHCSGGPRRKDLSSTVKERKSCW
jgi:hypothetical protein